MQVLESEVSSSSAREGFVATTNSTDPDGHTPALLPLRWMAYQPAGLAGRAIGKRITSGHPFQGHHHFAWRFHGGRNGFPQ